MSIQYILGRAGSGKSAYCLQEIKGKLAAKEGDNPLVLLVPEQATFKYEHALVTSPELGGFMRAQVLSFRRLAFRVMQETGGTARVHISDNGKKMLLHKLLYKIKDELRVFRSSASQPGFIDKLSEMLVELKRYRIGPEQLAEELRRANHSDYPAELSDKLADLTRILALYEKEIGRLYVDAEDDLAMLAERFGQSAYAGSAEVWVDGFNGFTPQEFEALSAILRGAKTVKIALCADRLYEASEQPEELDLFHPTATTLIRLRRMAAELGLSEEKPIVLGGNPHPRHSDSPMLAELERLYPEARAAKEPVHYLKGDIRIVSAAHRRAEAEAVSRSILELVRDRGYRWRDTAVLVRNMEGYRDVLATAFDDAGIPHFFDQKRSVAHHPLPELIRSSLEAVRSGWRYEQVFRAVKTGMLVPEEILSLDLDQLENYVLSFGIHGTRWTDTLPWTYMPYLSLEEDRTDRTEKEAAHLSRINAVRECVAGPLRVLESSLKKAGTVQEMAEAVYGLLTETRAASRLQAWSDACLKRGEVDRAKAHAGIWGSVIDLLDQFVEMMGEERLPLETFMDLLDTGLENMKLGLVPPALDQVLIGSMERSRPGAVKHVFILGANDGVLPSAMKEDGILTERERDKLAQEGLVLAPGSVRRLLDEGFMIYSALALPSESLWISYPIADDEGKALLPSEVIRRVMRIFPQIKTEYAAGDPPAGSDDKAATAYISHPAAAMSGLTLQLGQAKKGLPVADAWWHLYNWFVGQEDWRDRLRRRISSLFYANREANLPSSAAERLYGKPLVASVSRMETFAACHFAHFATYGLRLKERRLYKLEAPDIGQLFHAALSEIGVRLQQEGKDFGSLTEAQIAEQAAVAVERLAPRLQSEILLSSNRYRYIARKLQQIVAKAASVLAEHGRRGAFYPIGLEIGFGKAGPLPPLKFTLESGTELEIAGRIDRIDRADGPDGTLLRVIDYKSSQTRLNLAEVYYGLSLQMLTYLDVAVTHAPSWIGSEAKPGGLLYFHVHQPLIRASAPLSEEEAEDELFKRYKMKGLVLADEQAVKLMDATLDKGHSTLIPVAMKADGSFYKSSSVMTPDEWGALRKHGRGMIRRIGGEIAAGQVDINPYRMGAETACAFCRLKPVCQFDPQMDGNDYAMKIPYKQDEIWTMLQAKGGEGK